MADILTARKENMSETPTTLPFQYHHNGCSCNPFYTNPFCYERYKKEQKEKKVKKVKKKKI